MASFSFSVLPAVWYASGLELEQDFGALLSEQARPKRDLAQVAEVIGGTAFVVVAVDARDRPLAERFADALVPRLEGLDEVLFVDGRLDLDFIEDRRLLFLSPDRLEVLVDEVADFIDRRLAETSGIFVDLTDEGADVRTFTERVQADMPAGELPVDAYLVGEDGKYLYLFARLAGSSGDLSFGRKALSAVMGQTERLRKEAAFPDDLGLRYSGSVLIRIEEDEIMKGDLQQSALLGFVGVVLLMLLSTRRLRTLPLVAPPLLIATAWTFAFARLAVGRLNIITGFLAAILFGLGVDFIIHLYLRYAEERTKGQSIPEAARTSHRSTGRAVVSSALTTAAAFGVVWFADFEGYQEFGLLAAAGILIVMAVSLVFFPALNGLLERARPMSVRPPKPPKRATCRPFPRAVATFVLVAMPAFFAYSALVVATGEVRFHTNWRDLKGESPASDFDDYIIESLGRSNTLTLIHVPRDESLPAVREAVEAFRAAFGASGATSAITRVLSIDTLVPPDQDTRLELIGALTKQLERIDPDRLSDKDRETYADLLGQTDVETFERQDVPESLRRRFETVTGQGSLMVLLTDNLFYEVDEVIAWAQEMSKLRGVLDHVDSSTAIMSENWVAGSVFAVVLGDGPFILWAALLAVFGVLWLDFRSVRHAGVVISSLVMGVVCIAGAMNIFGLDLNFMNAVILPSLVGIGIDGAIHVYHRYLEGGPSAMQDVLRHTSRATLLAAATTMIGFGVMIFAHHRGIRSVGQLAIVGVIATYLSTSVFFPLALERMGKWRGRRPPVGTAGTTAPETGS